MLSSELFVYLSDIQFWLRDILRIYKNRTWIYGRYTYLPSDIYYISVLAFCISDGYIIVSEILTKLACILTFCVHKC